MKYLILVVLSFLYLNSDAQKNHKKTTKLKWQSAPINPNKFTGIGIFKIGIDTSVVLKYALENFAYIKDCSNIQDYMDYKARDFDGLLKLQKTYGSLYNPGTTTDDPDVDEYLIGKYTVSNITLEHLQLKFFKGKLVKCTCDANTDLVDGLTQKYGEPEKTDTHRKFECLYNLTGITRTITENSFFQTWYNGRLIAFDFLGETYDDHCNPKPSSYFDYSVPTPDIDKWEETESYNVKQINKPKTDLKDL